MTRMADHRVGRGARKFLGEKQDSFLREARMPKKIPRTGLISDSARQGLASPGWSLFKIP